MVVRDDRVLPATRALCLFIVPFLLVAFVVLFVFPDETERLFAWRIAPRMTPMMLGAVYLGGAYFFLRAAAASEWHRISAGFIPVGTFASMLGIATIVHWEKFNHDHVAFWLWAGLYFGAPPLVFAVWFANRRYRRPATAADGPIVPPAARAVIAAVGVLASATSLFLFLAPSRAIEEWPWALTPLTSRVMGALFALGLGGLFIAADRRWTAAKLMLEVEGVMLGLILVAGVRSHADLDFSRPLTIAFVVGFAATLVASVALYRRMSGRGPAPSTLAAAGR